MNDIKTLKRLQAVNGADINISLEKKPSFRVQINRYKTNVDGTIQNKATLPAAFQVPYPFYLFNAYDEAGAYFAANRDKPPIGPVKFLYNFTYKGSFDLLSFSGANNVKEKFNIGDQIFVFSDSEQFPSFFVWVQVTVELRAYASILKNPVDTGIKIFSIQYSADNDSQFDHPLSFTEQNERGDTVTDDISPRVYKTPDYQQDGFIVIKLNNWALTNWRGINSYIDFDCDQINLIFRYLRDF